jgi:hypothetical protein
MLLRARSVKSNRRQPDGSRILTPQRWRRSANARGPFCDNRAGSTLATGQIARAGSAKDHAGFLLSRRKADNGALGETGRSSTAVWFADRLEGRESWLDRSVVTGPPAE